VIVIEGGANHLAALEAGESVRCAEIGAGTHAEDDDAFENASFPDADAHELTQWHFRTIIPFATGKAGGFVIDEAEKERGVTVEIHGRIEDRRRAFFDRVATVYRHRRD
jgi:hypothetical protein